MVPNNINEFESNLLIYVYGNKKRRPRACRIHKSLSFTVTYDGNVVLLDNGLCLYGTMQGKARRAVVPFIINITMEINFSSKVYSKSLLNRLYDITCDAL